MRWWERRIGPCSLEWGTGALLATPTPRRPPACSLGSGVRLSEREGPQFPVETGFAPCQLLPCPPTLPTLPLALLLPLPTPSTPQASRPGAGLTPASGGASTWPGGSRPPGPSDLSHRCGPHIILQTQSPWPPLAFLRGFLTPACDSGLMDPP